MTTQKVIPACLAVLLLIPGFSKAADSKDFSEFLQDSSVGEISAGSILGIDSSSVQTVHSAKDFNVLANAFSQGDNGKGVAFLVSPIRVLHGYGAIPITSDNYGHHPVLLGLIENINLSYAQNKRTIGSTEFDQHAYSISTSTYLKKDQDPIYQVWYANKGCKVEKDLAQTELNKALDAQFHAPEAGKDAAQRDVEQKAAALDQKTSECIARQTPEKVWNPDNVSLSFGHGSIGSGSTGNYSLGYISAVTAQFGIGPRLALSIAGQHVQRAADVSSIDGLATRTSSSVGMVQLTTNPGDAEARTRFLAEWSTVKSKTPLAAKSNFKYAAGLDYQLSKNLGAAWLQFRFGKSYANAAGTLSNASMLSLSFGSTSTVLPTPTPPAQ